LINWPGHGRWYNQRYAVSTGEFTIHQTLVPSALLYGAVSAPHGYVDNITERPDRRMPQAGGTARPRMSFSQGSVIVGSADSRPLPGRIAVCDLNGRLVSRLQGNGTARATGVMKPGAGMFLLKLEDGDGMRAYRFVAP